MKKGTVGSETLQCYFLAPEEGTVLVDIFAHWANQESTIQQAMSPAEANVYIVMDVDSRTEVTEAYIEEQYAALQTSTVILINKDSSHATLFMLKAVEAGFTTILTFGRSPQSDCRLIKINKQDNHFSLRVNCKAALHEYTFHAEDEQDAKDSLAVFLLLHVCHTGKMDAAKMLSTLPCMTRKKISVGLAISFDATKAQRRCFKKAADETFELLFVGDTSFGENYQQSMKAKGGDNILESEGYDHPLKRMKRALLDSDFVVSNLETPITDYPTSPFEGVKDYIHWTDVELAPKTLQKHNIGLVSLANNHTFDYGVPGYDQTLAILRNKNLPWIGAGNTIQEAAQPFVGEITFGDKTFRFAIIAAFDELRNYRQQYQVYADKDEAGLMPLNAAAIGTLIEDIKAQDPDCFVIVFPHWGGNYQWRDKHQINDATTLMDCGADLIVGHGAHMIQEIERVDTRWVLYSLGNFMFNSRGRYQKMHAPPFSTIAKLAFRAEGDVIKMELKLYPIVTDNLLTRYQPRFLTEQEFGQLSQMMADKKVNANTQFAGLARGQDDYGHYWQLPMASSSPAKHIPTENYIGMLCRVMNVRPVDDYMFVWMYRAIAIDKYLVSQGYRLLCYTPADVDPQNKTVTGYIYEDGEFKAVITAIPKINYDWHIGKVPTTNKPGFKYRAYEAWAIEQGLQIYPGKNFRQLTNDKYSTFQLIKSFDATLVPATEMFTASEAQLHTFLQHSPSVFIKPRSGSMGDKIFVLRKQDDGFHITYYQDKLKTQQICATPGLALDYCVEKMDGESYIIQTAIEALRHQHSVFDVRVVMLNDGEAWHSMNEIRVGVANSDLSNVSQGGKNHISEEILTQCMPVTQATAMLKKIENVSRKLAVYLNKHYGNQVNEFAIDYIIDIHHQLSIAELNVKPGLSGMPDIFDDFRHMSDHEKDIYNKYTLPHGKLLALFLLRKAKQYTEQKPRYWFDAIKKPLSISTDDLSALTTAVYQVAQQRQLPCVMTAPSLAADKQPRVVFLSLTDGQGSAVIQLGAGAGISAAINLALEYALHLFPQHSELKGLKLDIVQSVQIYPEASITDIFNGDRSLNGLAFSASIGCAFLPEQILTNNLMTEDGKLRLDKMTKLDFLPERAYQQLCNGLRSTIYQFTTQSAFSCPTYTSALYRGHALYPVLNHSVLMEAVNSAANYLARNVRDDGTFVYEYWPKKDASSPRYNILRHAGSVYSMLEYVEVHQQASLLNAAKKALVNLVKRARPVIVDGQETLCIVEDDNIKLGANALTILALSKYAKVTGDMTFLSIAQQCARWMVATQSASGEFSCHKQKFSSHRQQKFISEYYPGEAIFALTRLYDVDNNLEWLNAAVKAAEFIITVRDNALPEEKLAHDHWLLYGLNECQRLQPNPLFVQHTLKICRAIMSKQTHTSTSEDHQGSFYRDARSTPTATRAEGLCAAYQCLMANGQQDAALAVYATIEKCIAFQLQTQFQLESTMYHPNPQRALGGFHKSLCNYSVRIDYVQHNISALLATARILQTVRLPTSVAETQLH